MSNSKYFSNISNSNLNPKGINQTFDKLNKAIEHGNEMNHPRYEPRVKDYWLYKFYNKLKNFNVICKYCEHIETYAEDYMNADESRRARIVEEVPSHHLEVSAVIAGNVSGTPIVKFQLNGRANCTNIPCDSQAQEPLMYPFFFFMANGDGALTLKVVCHFVIICYLEYSYQNILNLI